MAPTTYLTGNAEWFTPPEIIRAVYETLGHIDLDPASCSDANQIVRAEKFFSVNDDGLDRNWFGRVYLNPPYSRGLIKKFVDKLIAEFKAGHVQSAVVLVNSQSDAKWFKSLTEICTGAIFTQGRIRFVQADGTPSKHTPTCGQCIFYIGNDPQKFFAAFEQFGYPVNFSTTNAPMNDAHKDLFSPKEQFELRMLGAQYEYATKQEDSMGQRLLAFSMAQIVRLNYLRASAQHLHAQVLFYEAKQKKLSLTGNAGEERINI